MTSPTFPPSAFTTSVVYARLLSFVDDDDAAAANDFSSEDGKGDFELGVRSRPRLLII